jgi:hypothetical protein
LGEYWDNGIEYVESREKKFITEEFIIEVSCWNHGIDYVDCRDQIIDYVDYRDQIIDYVVTIVIK